MSEAFVDDTRPEVATAPVPVGLGPFRAGANWGQAAKEYLQAARSLLFGRHRAGAAGGEIVAAYTAVIDHLITAMYAVAANEYAKRHVRLDQRLAIVAQGGYGRRELNPCSDLDLLIIFPRRLEPFVETVAERILYPLWDTGLEVGYAFRNFRECVRLAASDFTVKTALLDARFLCGDAALYKEFAALVERSVLGHRVAEFVRRKIAEYESRHRRYGDSVYLLEPELKEGEGGLRDLHTAMWLARLKFKTSSVEGLVRQGLLLEREIADVESARDFLWRVRNALHFESGRHLDRLTFEYQEKLAPALGFRDNRELKAVEQFMRRYYLHAGAVNRFATEMIDRCRERRRPYRTLEQFVGRNLRPGVRLANQRIAVRDPALFSKRPADMLAIFRDCQRYAARLSNATRRLVRASLQRIDDALRAAPETAEIFRDILRWKVDVYETLLEMHKLGVLAAYLPEFGHLLCMVQHDLYHIYTVDEHSLMGIRELERLRAGEYKESTPLLTQMARELDSLELVFLGIMFHDIGKGRGGRHSERGAAMAQEIAQRLHLNADEARELEFLVRHHLLMSHLAQRRDIHDQRLVVEFARKVGDPETLKKLYLLTFADMKAVGPEVWNNWKDLLLGELYRQAAEVLETGRFVAEAREARAARIKQRVARRLEAEGATPARGAEFLRVMPDRYFLSTAEERIPHHFWVLSRLEGDSLVTAVRHFPEWEFSEFTVVTQDRPGLFATITGVLAAHGMNILGASITTSADGKVLDVFRIAPGRGAEMARDASRWERIQADVERVLRGGGEVADLLAAARPPPFMTQRVVPRVSTNVEIDNEVSDQFTVLDVYAQDRLGLLYAITDTLYFLGLSIHLAKVTTNVDQVLDVFYVADSTGRKIEDRERLDEIREVLRSRLQQLE